jgi:transposase-like protein
MQSISAEKRRVALLREFEGGGLSMAEFCRRRGVGYSTMAAWRRTWGNRPAATFVEVEPLLAGPSGGGGSTAVAAHARSTGSLCAELMLPGGAVLRVYQIHPTGGEAS